MTADKTLIWRLVNEGFNEGREAVAHEVLHSRYRNDTSVMAVPDGPEGLAAHIRNGRSSIAGIRLNIVDIVADGDTAAVCWQTRGKAGGYVGHGESAGDTSAWLIGFCGYEDGLIRQHVINWEPLRLLAQSGALKAIYDKRGPLIAADLTGFSLNALRFQGYSRYAQQEEATKPRPPSPGERDAIQQLVRTTVCFEFGAQNSNVAPALSQDAYLSFADSPDARGANGLEGRREQWCSAFSGNQVEFKTLLVESGRATVRFEITCSNTGSFAGLPATGRRITATGSAYARVRDGVIVEWIEVIDVLRILRQLGGLANVLPGCYPDQ
jgi:predicted ester cyclase